MRYRHSCGMLSPGTSCVTVDFSAIMSASDSPAGEALSLWAMPGGILTCHKWGSATDIWCMVARDAAFSRQPPVVG